MDSGYIGCSNAGIESYVVDPASFVTSRRRRRAKTDRIEGEALVRALLPTTAASLKLGARHEGTALEAVQEHAGPPPEGR